MLVPDVGRWFAWAPLATAVAHIFEEFVFPGGFMSWYSRYRGPAATSVNPRFLVIINFVLLAVCFNAGLAAQKSEALPYWLGIVALLCSNGVWHIWAAIRSHGYAPGMITGAILYIPLAIYGLVHLIRTGLISVPIAALAIVVGGSYPIWSASISPQIEGLARGEPSMLSPRGGRGDTPKVMLPNPGTITLCGYGGSIRRDASVLPGKIERTTSKLADLSQPWRGGLHPRGCGSQVGIESKSLSGEIFFRESRRETRVRLAS